MADIKPIIQVIDVADAQIDLAGLVGQVSARQKQIALQQGGKTVAGIVSASDLEQLRRLSNRRERALANLDKMGAAFADVPPDELDREIAKAVDEVREERRAKLQAILSSTQ